MVSPRWISPLRYPGGKVEKFRKKIAKEYKGDMSTWDEWSENPAVVRVHRVERHPFTAIQERIYDDAQG